ncbi:hypothetical protein LIER_16378 [Lithospermum erythrorhizon]|uniref:Uncharacterized protein n=1 Tax=Lithospermum erythrorhizon TaxID=34254 RepID=A0AAV3Q6T8_LITER
MEPIEQQHEQEDSLLTKWDRFSSLIAVEISESDGTRLAPAEGCVYSGPTSRFFSLSQLKRATNNFSSDNLIHEGSLGVASGNWGSGYQEM